MTRTRVLGIVVVVTSTTLLALSFLLSLVVLRTRTVLSDSAMAYERFARVVANYSDISLEIADFDSSEAEAVLSELKFEDEITVAALYTEDGKEIARFDRGLEDANLKRPEKLGTFYSDDGHLNLTQEVTKKGGGRVGTLYLRARTTKLRRLVWRNAGLATAVFLVAFSAANLVSVPLRLRAILRAVLPAVFASLCTLILLFSVTKQHLSSTVAKENARLAKFVASQSIGPLATAELDEGQGAQAVLLELASIEAVAFATLHDRQGERVAHYQNGELKDMTPRAPKEPGTFYIARGFIDTLEYINLDNEKIGTLHLRASTDNLRRRVLRDTITFVVLTVLLFALTSVTSFVSWRLISAGSGNGAKRDGGFKEGDVTPLTSSERVELLSEIDEIRRRLDVLAKIVDSES